MYLRKKEREKSVNGIENWRQEIAIPTIITNCDKNMN